MTGARLGLTRLALVASALLVAACGEAEREATAGGEAGWRPVPAGPLSAREAATAFWTGGEVVVVGGSDAPPCPPTADCVAPEVPPLADGAAFDPGRGEWRRIADAPVPFDWAEVAVAGATAYLWIPGTPGRPGARRALLAYDTEADRWQRLAIPRGAPEHARLVAAGERIVLYGSSDEHGEEPDLVLDPSGGSWSRLPDDPLSPSFDRSMAWSGEELVLFDKELVPNPGSEEPSITRAAALDVAGGRWRRLPDSQILSSGPWALDAGRLINPTLGGADGGEVGGYGRTYPFGGVLDPRDGTWSPLPEGPAGDGLDAVSAGVLTRSGAHFLGWRGWVLDATAGEWLRVPALDGDDMVTGRAVAAAGRSLFAFGGARWPDGASARLLADAWIWSPRR